MARIQISEYPPSEIANIPVAREPRLAAQEIAIGGASVQSSAFTGGTGLIRVKTDAICSFKIGPNPTAVVTEGRMSAEDTEYFAVNPGDKIAVITNT